MKSLSLAFLCGLACVALASSDPACAIAHGEWAARVGPALTPSNPANGVASAQDVHPGNSSNLQVVFMEGQRALARGDLDQAENLFQEVLSRDPANAGAHANLGVIAMRRRHWHQALAELKRARQLAPEIPGIRLNIGLTYYREGDYRSAVPPLSSVLRDEPQSVQARYLLGLCYFLAAKYQAALDALKPLWSAESNNLSFLYVLSVAADKVGDRKLDYQAAGRMLRIGGNSPAVHLLIGKADLARQANEAAIKELQTAARANPHLPFVHFYLGIGYRRLHQFVTAKTEFLDDLAVDPGITYTYNELGMVCTYLNEDQQAKEYFHQAVRLDSNSASAYYGLAKIELQEKQYRGAWEDLAQAGRLDPHSASIHYLKGQILMAMGRRTAAQSEFRTAAQMQKATRDELLREISGARLPNPEMATEP